MLASRTRLASGSAIALLMAAGLLAGTAARAQTAAEEEDPVLLGTIVISAEEQIKQALGASTITAEDIAKTPVVNDIAEIIRKQPGVNLTGNSVSGQRGNNRQIDLRGMGPENTLILIDGRPVMSRNAVRMGRQGERDTRGDTSWVPPELVERIEVIRGPAAARYGSGAAGGVVNIITKKPETFSGSVGLHYDLPQSDLEGDSLRSNFVLAGPLGETLSFRIYGNYSKSDPDDPRINVPDPSVADCTVNGDGQCTYPAPAGSEGVISKDLNALLSWRPTGGHEIDFEFGISRQGNRYAGDVGTGSESLEETPAGDYLLGTETNRMLRRSFSTTHRGEYDFGESFSYLQYEDTVNTRNGEGTAGSGEGDINTAEKRTWEYESVTAKSEWILPGRIFGRDATYTLGAEYRGEFMDDEGREFTAGEFGEQHLLGVYAEANILWGEALTLTPGLRYDYSNRFGSNASPSLNATYEFTDAWSMKLGIARAFKAPNIFQLNPSYRYSTMGMGCPSGVATPCEILGNPDLKPEHSINKEIGVAYDNGDGLAGSLTWFHNDYKNRIAADLFSAVPNPAGGSTLVWGNTPEALIEGLEGNISTRLGEMFHLNVNFTKMIESVNKQTGNPLSLVPEHTINATLDWYAREDLTFTLSATHYGRIEGAVRTTSTNVPIAESARVSRDPYTLVNLGMKWDVNDSAWISAGVTNLFNETILRTSAAQGDANTFNEPGRSFYIGLNHSF